MKKFNLVWFLIWFCLGISIATAFTVARLQHTVKDLSENVTAALTAITEQYAQLESRVTALEMELAND